MACALRYNAIASVYATPNLFCFNPVEI